jgi:hypothetical protein
MAQKEVEETGKFELPERKGRGRTCVVKVRFVRCAVRAKVKKFCFENEPK